MTPPARGVVVVKTISCPPNPFNSVFTEALVAVPPSTPVPLPAPQLAVVLQSSTDATELVAPGSTEPLVEQVAGVDVQFVALAASW
jgi:hypothetical protein